MVQHSTEKAVQFIKDITYRFGVPHCIITDLGTTFTSNAFWTHCDQCGIEVYYASMAHPQANGQVERANGMILDGLKARVFDQLKKVEGR